MGQGQRAQVLPKLLCSRESDHGEHERLDGRMCPGKGYRWGYMDRPRDMPAD